MKEETLDTVITIRCTVKEKEIISEAAWKARKTMSALFRPSVIKLAKQLTKSEPI